ncbi:ATP-dependent DNA helicase, partial [Candidatus Woesearchaeota archaeon]
MDFQDERMTRAKSGEKKEAEKEIEEGEKQNTKERQNTEERFLFPFQRIRKSQKEMLNAVERALRKRRHLIVHAPTGLGKTIASLGPALKYAEENDKTVFFVTSRHTQHIIAVETLRRISEKFGRQIVAADIIGKKWMCLQKNVQVLFSGEFAEYCRKLIEEKKCEYYEKLRKGSTLSADAQQLLKRLLRRGVNSTKEIIKEASARKICPYYLSLEIAKQARVVITDYYYIFNPAIRESFFNRAGMEIENSIIIVDEGHNLGDRIRDLASSRISSNILKRAIIEAKKNSYEHLIPLLSALQNFLITKAKSLSENEEGYVERDELISALEEEFAAEKESGAKEDGPQKAFREIISTLENAADIIRETQRQSYIGSIASFLEQWQDEDEGFARIISLKEGKSDTTVVLERICLDPSVVVSSVLELAHSVIMMSGTLEPTKMYRDLLGFPERTDEKSYKSPFAEENRRIIIVPSATTKYTARNSEQFRKIAEVTAEIVNSVPGNSAVFFPSYFLRDAVHREFSKMSRRTIFLERSEMTKEEKEEFLSRFKEYKDSGAVLLGVISGSFGEGIDLPGDYLKAVVIVGLPLQKPTLETKSLIEYFDRKFGRGWEYGYVFPAFNKAVQSAGRCIRTEKDRGVIAFVDLRYTWPQYSRLFPSDWNPVVTVRPGEIVKEFFGSGNRD